ncbi:aquaporin-9-like [Tachypleus tridentatus]|uniref:aquaporin-9-like n=1 Tax=Tachypleus tridentatus TaxID=6853 RepID=UPI003FD48D0D
MMENSGYLGHIRIKSDLLRQCLSEFIGTLILVLFGDSILAVVILGKIGSAGAVAVPLGWGLGLMIGIAVSGGVSGGHLNPAVTIAFATVGKFKWRKIPAFLASQYLGGFAAAALVFFVYEGAFENFDGGFRSVIGENATAHIFATYPQEFVHTGNGLIDQILGTFLLMIAISAIIDDKNMNIAQGLQPLLIGLSLTAIINCFGFNCQASLNPARDLSPRIFTAMAGWGIEVFSFRNYNWFWVPVIGPHIGAVIGVWIYRLMIELHWPADSYDFDQSVNNFKGSAFGSLERDFNVEMKNVEVTDAKQ